MDPKHFIPLLTLTLLILYLVGCEKRVETLVQPRYAFMQPVDTFDISFIPLLAPSGKNIFYSSMTDSEMQVLQPIFDDGAHIMEEIEGYIDSTASLEDWTVTDQKIRTVLNDFLNHPTAYFIDQIAASKMLWRRLLDSSVTAQKQEAVAFYTNLLLENHHPDAVVFVRALEYLGVNTFWSDTLRSHAAEQALSFVTEYLQKENFKTCNCTVESDDPMFNPLMNAKDVKLERMNNAKHALDSLKNL